MSNLPPKLEFQLRLAHLAARSNQPPRRPEVIDFGMTREQIRRSPAMAALLRGLVAAGVPVRFREE